MISSGKKRGLATVAVSALAVAGLPFLASPASAAGESISLLTTGPTRNAGDTGGAVVLKTKGIDAADLDNFGLATYDLSSDNSSDYNNAAQSVELPATMDSTPAPTGSRIFVEDGEDGNTDGFDTVVLFVKASGRLGTPVKYGIFYDVDPTGPTAGLDSQDPAVPVSVDLAGAPTSIALSPTTATAAQGAAARYTASFKDAAGNATQLNSGDNAKVNRGSDTSLRLNGNDVASENLATALQGGQNFQAVAYGNYGFTVASSVASLHSFTVTADGATAATGQLDVVVAASGIKPSEVELVSDAQFGDLSGAAGVFETSPTGVTLRTDQKSFVLNFKSPSNADRTVSLSLTGTGLTFGGRPTTTVSTTLNADGVGSVTITPDATSIGNGDSIAISGGLLSNTTGPVNNGQIKVSYADAVYDGVKLNQPTYYTAFGGTTDITATVVDQFGLPFTDAFVGAAVTGPNAQTVAPVALNSAGQATVAIKDEKATATSASDSVQVTVFRGVNQTGSYGTANATIQYNTDGVGPDFAIQVNGQTPTGTAWDPKNASALPLTDTVADSAAEYITVTTPTGGTPGSEVTVTVDNGALVLPADPKKNKLSDGASSQTGVFSNATSGNVFRIIGTKAGLVNVTVTSDGHSHTAVVSVAADQDASSHPDTARNVSITGPASATANETVTFTATVTDAFGNPVKGVSLTPLVSGPAQLQSPAAAKTDADGVVSYQVQLSNSAASSVSLQVTGTTGQFGAAADRLDSQSKTDDAVGLTASTNVATATISDVANVEALQAAVDEAQAKVNAAEVAVIAAQGELDVAKAERKVANRAVKAAKKDVRKAKRAVKKAPKAKKAAKRAQLRVAKRDLREARGDKRIAKVKVKAKRQVVKSAKSALATAQAELEAAQQALEDAQGGEAQG